MKINGWNEMPIGVLQQIDDINQLHIDAQEKVFKITALLAGIPYDVFLNLPISQSQEMIQATDWLDTPPKKKKIKREYVIDGETYVLFRDMGEMTTAQYIDYQAAWKPELKLCISELLGIALIPKGKKYNEGYNHNDLVEKIENNFNVEEALGIADFFIRRFRKSMKRLWRKVDTMTTLLVWKAPKEKKKEMKDAKKTIMELMNGYLSAFGSISQKLSRK